MMRLVLQARPFARLGISAFIKDLTLAIELYSFDSASNTLQILFCTKTNWQTVQHLRLAWLWCANYVRSVYSLVKDWFSVTYSLVSSMYVVSPNDIHYIEKLSNGFWSGSAILNAAPFYVPCKNSHSRSKSRPIALQHISNWSTFVHLFNSAGKNIPCKKILPAFSCFSRFLQISLDF